MRTVLKLSAIALAIAASSAAHALATYSFVYEGTQFSYPAGCTSPCEPGPSSPWSGTLTLTLTGGVVINSLTLLPGGGIDWTSGHEPAPYADGFFGSSWDGYTGRQVDPNTEITISVDGNSPLHLSNNFSASVFHGVASFGGNAQQPGSNGFSALYIFGSPHIEMGSAHLDHSETYASGILTAVPEPESWALMLAGFGVVGAIGRRRLGRKGRWMTGSA